MGASRPTSGVSAGRVPGPGRASCESDRNSSSPGCPRPKPFVLAEANHLLHVQNPRGMAEGLAAFFGRHPLKAQ